VSPRLRLRRASDGVAPKKLRVLEYGRKQAIGMVFSLAAGLLLMAGASAWREVTKAEHARALLQERLEHEDHIGAAIERRFFMKCPAGARRYAWRTSRASGEACVGEYTVWMEHPP